jgi:hypothetical protein
MQNSPFTQDQTIWWRVALRKSALVPPAHSAGGMAENGSSQLQRDDHSSLDNHWSVWHTHLQHGSVSQPA